MAKSTRSGLGRGLNSLLGFDEDPINAEVESKEEKTSEIKEEPKAVAPAGRVVVESSDLQQVINSETAGTPSYKPVSAPKKPNSGQEVNIDKPLPQKASEAVVENKEETIQNKVEKNKQVDEVPLNFIEPNPDQPRTNFKKEEIEELASSIQKDGLLQPIVVRPLAKDKYQIIAGERRWQACRYLKLETVPVRIREANEDKALELALIENIQRSDLNPIEEAYGYRRLMERMNLTQSEIAQVVSKGRSTIANALRLLELPEEAQQLLFEEKITAGHARAILSVPTAEGRRKLTDKLMNEKLSVRETEAIARLLSGKKEASSASNRVPTPSSYKKVAKTLRDVLQTNVRVKTVQGKNKIEIEFKDEEDLRRLFDEIVSHSEE